MKNTLTNPRFIFVATAILIVSLSRILPHPPNFTPLAAMALFGASYFGSRTLAFVVPFLALFISDLFIGFHNTMLSVYIGFALTVLIGFSLRNSRKPGQIILASLSSSVLFFLISNFSVWLQAGFYPLNLSGLMECYTAAIPFFRNSIAGDLFFCAVLFGSFNLASIKFPRLSKA